jgi:predicted esterase
MSGGATRHVVEMTRVPPPLTAIVRPVAVTATVIFMHGLGDTCVGWVDAVTEFWAPSLPYVKFILPSAPERPITLNGGMHMPGWYDIRSLSGDRAKERCEGIDE